MHFMKASKSSANMPSSWIFLLLLGGKSSLSMSLKTFDDSASVCKLKIYFEAHAAVKESALGSRSLNGTD